MHFTIVILQLWIFRAAPSAFFCTDPNDACTCSGGGFDLYKPFCGGSTDDKGTSGQGNATTSAVAFNVTTNTTAELNKIVSSYVDPFEFMGDNVLTFIFGFLSMVSILAVLAVALYTLEAHQKDASIQKIGSKIALEEDLNKRLRDKMKLTKEKEAQYKAHITNLLQEVQDLKLGTMIPADELEIMEDGKLGQGSFGAVVKGKLYGEIVAVKKVLPQYLEDTESREAFKDEVKIMSPLKHENCVFLYGASKLASEEIALVMEYAGRGSLSDTIDLQDHRSICWATVLEGVVM